MRWRSQDRRSCASLRPRNEIPLSELEQRIDQGNTIEQLIIDSRLVDDRPSTTSFFYDHDCSYAKNDNAMNLNTALVAAAFLITDQLQGRDAW